MREVANDIAGPRELEANLLLQAAAKLQAVQNSWKEKPGATKEAVLFNRRLWTVFLELPDPGEGPAPGGASRELEDAWCVRNVRDLFAGDKASEETF